MNDYINLKIIFEDLKQKNLSSDSEWEEKNRQRLEQNKSSKRNASLLRGGKIKRVLSPHLVIILELNKGILDTFFHSKLAQPILEEIYWELLIWVLKLIIMIMTT